MQHYDPTKRIDLIPQTPNPPPRHPTRGQRYPLVGGKVQVRKAEDIWAIGLHQTAVDFAASAQQIRAEHGDARMALAMRAEAHEIPAHVVSFTEGFFVTAIPLLWYAYCGNGMNAYALQVEIDGKYCGRTADRLGSTWGGSPMTLTKQTIETARNAVGYLYEEGRKLGCPLTHYLAHRQFTAKTSDPGEELWVSVGIDFCEKELGLKPKLEYWEKDKKGKKGAPIPHDWDPRSSAKY